MRKNQVLLCLLGAGMAWTPSLAFAKADANMRTSIVAAPDNQVIKGTVADADGPLIGATVKVAGTNNGTVTDCNRKFASPSTPGPTRDHT